jgi:hypothetical protein
VAEERGIAAAENLQMQRIVLLAVLVAAALVPSQSSFAYREARWCVIYQIGFETAQERCDFDTFEQCYEESMLWGTTAFCNLNPRYRGDSPRQPRQRPRRDRQPTR